jgi:hypothetical protein
MARWHGGDRRARCRHRAGTAVPVRGFEVLAAKLEEGGAERELEVPERASVREGEWVLATIAVGGNCTSVAACAVDRGDGIRILFADGTGRACGSSPRWVAPERAAARLVAADLSARADGGRVLIVVDDDGGAHVVCSVLENAGYRAAAVGSAEEAFDALRTTEVDLVVLTGACQGWTGRLLPPPAARPPISRHAGADDVVPLLPLRALRRARRGADDFVGKPFRARSSARASSPAAALPAARVPAR